MESKFIKLDKNITYHFLDRTKDENDLNFLMVHGLSSSAFLWRPLVDELGDNFNYYALDLRGHGLSSKPENGYDLETLRNDVNLFIQKLNLKNIIIIGQSMGAEVSVMSSLINKNIIGCIAIDGGVINLKEKFKSKDECLEILKPPDLNGLKKDKILNILRENHSDWSEKAIMGQFSIFDVDDEDKIIKRLELKNHLKLLESLWENNSVSNLKSIPVPILFILVNFDINLKDFEHAKIKLKVKKLIGDHDIHAQKPKVVSNIIKDELKSGFFE